VPTCSGGLHAASAIATKTRMAAFGCLTFLM
jgi:hypothetical protein